MYVNTIITLQENMPTYTQPGKTLTGHVTLMSPGWIKCYIQNLKPITNDLIYTFYIFSKAKQKGVRLGNLSSQKETKWLVDENNIENSGLNLEDIDGVCIVEELEDNKADAIVSGFLKERYIIMPIIEGILKKLNASKVTKTEAKTETKTEAPTPIEVVKETIEPAIEVVKETVEPAIEVIKEEIEPTIEVIKEKVEPVEEKAKSVVKEKVKPVEETAELVKEKVEPVEEKTKPVVKEKVKPIIELVKEKNQAIEILKEEALENEGILDYQKGILKAVEAAKEKITPVVKAFKEKIEPKVKEEQEIQVPETQAPVIEVADTIVTKEIPTMAITTDVEENVPKTDALEISQNDEDELEDKAQEIAQKISVINLNKENTSEVGNTLLNMIKDLVQKPNKTKGEQKATEVIEDMVELEMIAETLKDNDTTNETQDCVEEKVEKEEKERVVDDIEAVIYQNQQHLNEDIQILEAIKATEAEEEDDIAEPLTEEELTGTTRTQTNTKTEKKGITADDILRLIAQVNNDQELREKITSFGKQLKSLGQFVTLNKEPEEEVRTVKAPEPPSPLAQPLEEIEQQLDYDFEPKTPIKEPIRSEDTSPRQAVNFICVHLDKKHKNKQPSYMDKIDKKIEDIQQRRNQGMKE